VQTQPFTLPDLKRIIIETLKLDGVTPEMIEDEELLFGGRFGLDSIDALELVVALEKRLGVKIRAHELDPSAFSSVAAMFRSLESRLIAMRVE
jgi:acyl carrier protein